MARNCNPDARAPTANRSPAHLQPSFASGFPRPGSRKSRRKRGFDPVGGVGRSEVGVGVGGQRVGGSAGDGGDGETVDEVVHAVAAVALDPAEGHVVASGRARSAASTGRRWRRAASSSSASRCAPTSPTTGRGSSSRRRSSRTRSRSASGRRVVGERGVGAQRLEHGDDLHPLVGGARLAAGSVRLAVGRCRPRPATRAGVPAAGTIGVDHECHRGSNLVRTLTDDSRSGTGSGAYRSVILRECPDDLRRLRAPAARHRSDRDAGVARQPRRGRRHARQDPGPVPAVAAARAGQRDARSRFPATVSHAVRQHHPPRGGAVVPRRRAHRAAHPGLHPLERGDDGRQGEQARRRHRRPPVDVRQLGVALRDRLQPLLPRQGRRHARRPRLLPGPRRARHLRPRLPRGPPDRRRPRPLPPGDRPRRTRPVVATRTRG